MFGKKHQLGMLSKPTEAQMQAFIEVQKKLPHSYPEIGHTHHENPITGYDNDFNFIELGRGEAVWQAAKTAIQRWKMFPGRWACIFPDDTPIREGETVAMTAQVLGLWWLNACRIVYVINGDTQFGFAYGTLPGHVEVGEELFMVEKLPDGSVQYIIKAFSKPRFWMARIGYPLTRFYQKKFVRNSKQSMLTFVQKHIA